ncbi:MAG: ExbD/TolR family protein [Bacteroidia bacterium]
MAQIHEGGAGHARTRGRPIRTRSRAYVDMTAMVDVAFLLLTFFVLTAVIGKDYVMDFISPPQDAPTTIQQEQKVLSVILDKDNKAFYYVGITDPEVKEAYVGSTSFRRIIQAHLNKDEKASILIKPRDTSNYGTLVNMLDELLITDAKRHALAPFTEADSLLIFHTTGI